MTRASALRHISPAGNYQVHRQINLVLRNVHEFLDFSVLEETKMEERDEAR